MAQQLSTDAVEGILANSFHDRSILWLILQAADFGIGGPDSNKTLAMIGDAVMKLVLLVDLTATGASRVTHQDPSHHPGPLLELL